MGGFVGVAISVTNEEGRLGPSLLWLLKAGVVEIGMWEGGIVVGRELALVTRVRFDGMLGWVSDFCLCDSIIFESVVMWTFVSMNGVARIVDFFTG